MDRSDAIDEMVAAEDFRVITERPVRVDAEAESKQMKIHHESVVESGVQRWGFSEAVDTLSALDENAAEYVAFKGAGYSAKLYLSVHSRHPVALVVTKRVKPAPPIDASGRVVSS